MVEGSEERGIARGLSTGAILSACKFSQMRDKLLGAPDMLERLAALGMKARSSSLEELATRVRVDSALWKSVITAAGISPE